MMNNISQNYKLYNQQKKVDPLLYDETARKIAEELIKIEKGSTYGVTRHQFRRIFDETKRIKKLIDIRGWEELYPLVKMIKSKTAYMVARAKSEKRKESNYYQNLYNFISTGIDQVKTVEDFKIFCLLFEAVYGFYYELGGALKK